MEDWEKKLLDNVNEVIKHGWGRCEIVITNNGLRKQYSKTITDVDIEKPLQSFKKGV